MGELQVDRAMVERIAHLARLHLSDEEIESYVRELPTVIRFVDQLSEVDCNGVLPLHHPHDVVGTMASDLVEPSLPRTDALSNAPETDGEYFLVPRVLGNS